MHRLIAGFNRFRDTRYPDLADSLSTLAERGQTPYAAVVACCDSRVDPQMIFGAPPGDLFVIRNVANLVPPYCPDADYHGTSAALEFAVRGLGVDLIVVMGHANCGGISALLGNDPERYGDFIGPWMTIAKEARAHAHAHAHGDRQCAQRQAELEGIRISLDNLMTFPWIEERVSAGKLGLHGLFYDFAAGDLRRLDRGSGRFVPVPPTPDEGGAGRRAHPDTTRPEPRGRIR